MFACFCFLLACLLLELCCFVAILFVCLSACLFVCLFVCLWVCGRHILAGPLTACFSVCLLFAYVFGWKFLDNFLPTRGQQAEVLKSPP